MINLANRKASSVDRGDRDFVSWKEMDNKCKEGLLSRGTKNSENITSHCFRTPGKGRGWNPQLPETIEQKQCWPLGESSRDPPVVHLLIFCRCL